MPEADWLEQHQPVSDEDEADVDAYPSTVHDGDDAISIELDTPEGDWIEQHQPIVEAPEEERFLSNDLPEEVVDAGELEQDWITIDEDVGAADDQAVPTPRFPRRPRELVAAMSSPSSRMPCCVRGATPPDTLGNATDARLIDGAGKIRRCRPSRQGFGGMLGGRVLRPALGTGAASTSPAGTIRERGGRAGSAT